VAVDGKVDRPTTSPTELETKGIPVVALAIEPRAIGLESRPNFGLNPEG